MTAGSELERLQELGLEGLGLEDFTTDDMTMPVIQIMHKEGVFEDKLSGVQYESLHNAVLLGLIKQRVLWPPKMGDGKEPPLCRSFDSHSGHTTEGFPWGASGLTADDVRKAEDGDENHFIAPCESCKLTEWDTHPSREAPWCSLQHTYAIALNDGGSYVPSILTIQRSGLKASNAYVTSFARSKRPLFTVFTDITLEQQSRGGNEFCKPKFLRSGATDPVDYEWYAETYKGIRAFVQTARGFDVGVSETPVSAPAPAGPPATAPAPAPAPAPAGPPAAAAPEAPAGPPAAAAPETPAGPPAATAPEAPAGPPAAAAPSVAPPAPASATQDLPF